MKYILLTGANGFVGSHLKKLLGDRVWSLKGPLSSSLQELSSAPEFSAVVHLAGISHVPTAEADPDKCFSTNLSGTLTLLEALNRRAQPAHFLFASTAQVYDGKVATEGNPLTEKSPTNPQNVYARSKLYAELALRDWAEHSSWLYVSALRFFNHTHHTQSEDFFLPYIYGQLLRARESGQSSVHIKVGNVNLRRDLGGVGDLVNALALLVDAQPNKKFDVFNVCSGHAKHLGELSHALADRLGLKLTLEVDPTRLRADDPPLIVGDHQKLTELTGWQPKATSIDALIEQFLL